MRARTPVRIGAVLVQPAVGLVVLQGLGEIGDGLSQITEFGVGEPAVVCDARPARFEFQDPVVITQRLAIMSETRIDASTLQVDVVVVGVVLQRLTK